MIQLRSQEELQEKRIPVDSLFQQDRHDPRPPARARAEDQHCTRSSRAKRKCTAFSNTITTVAMGRSHTFNVLFADREDQFVGQKGDGNAARLAVALLVGCGGSKGVGASGSVASPGVSSAEIRVASRPSRSFDSLDDRLVSAEAMRGSAGGPRLRHDEQPVVAGPGRFPRRHGEARRRSLVRLCRPSPSEPEARTASSWRSTRRALSIPFPMALRGRAGRSRGQEARSATSAPCR